MEYEYWAGVAQYREVLKHLQLFFSIFSAKRLAFMTQCTGFDSVAQADAIALSK